MGSLLAIGLLSLLTVSINAVSLLSLERFRQTTPNSFGLLVIVSGRTKSNSEVSEMLDRLATIECTPMSQIAVILSDQSSSVMEVLTSSSEWLRPVHFSPTPSTEFDFQYALSPQSKAQVFFLMDEGISTTCAELTRSFQIWRKHAVGDLGSIVTYDRKSFELSGKPTKLTIDSSKSTHFSIGAHAAWISRFYLHLFNSENLWQSHGIRRAASHRLCRDIGLNSVIEYYFPELISIFAEGDLNFSAPIENREENEQIRTECLVKVSEAVGFSPLRIKIVNPDPLVVLYRSTFIEEAIFMKRKLLAERLEGEDKQISQVQISKISSTGQSRGEELATQQPQQGGLLEELEQAKKELTFLSSLDLECSKPALDEAQIQATLLENIKEVSKWEYPVKPATMLWITLGALAVAALLLRKKQ